MNIKVNAGFWNTVLFLLFLTLKLTHTIDWSWWWIFSPFWIPIMVGAVIFAGFAIVSLMACMYSMFEKK